MRSTRIAMLGLALALIGPLAPARAAVSFQLVTAFATKTGFRAVVAWQASEPIAGQVRWGTSSTALTNVTQPVANLVDRAQMAFLEQLEPGTTYYYRIVDQITNAASAVQSFKAVNATTSYNSTTKYTVNAVAVLDAPAAPDGVPGDLGLEDIAGGVNILAERVYDATDGWMRLGTVLVTDTHLNYPANVPARGTMCRTVAGAPAGGTPADFLVQTTVPLDSHTWRGLMISNPCTAFYIGRLGWLGDIWVNDLDLGYTMAHEFAHYAFDAPDLYTTTSPGCANIAWDGSLMTNIGGWVGDRWLYTELDRTQQLTPCDHSVSNDWSWSMLRKNYPQVPAPTTPQHIVDSAARGNADGGGLKIYILDHSANGMSRLIQCTPDDAAPGCSNL